MSDDNNINIGSIGNANHINIAQSQSSMRNPIEFEVVASSVQRLSRASVNKGAWYFAGSIPAFALSVMSILADATGIFPTSISAGKSLPGPSPSSACLASCATRPKAR